MLPTGMIDTDSEEFRKLTEGMSKQQVSAAMADTAEALKHCSEPGVLNLPALLDERRLEYAIPDSVFDADAVLRRVYGWQLGPRDLSTGMWGDDSLIAKTDQRKDVDRETAPRMLILSMGLTAMDNLIGHGIDLGHIVTLLRESPFVIRTGTIDGKPVQVCVVDAGDICGSEDIAEGRRKGELKIVRDKATMKHHILGNDNEPFIVKTRGGF